MLVPANTRLLQLTGAPIVVGEVAQAHDGSLGFAHAFVDVVADAGADAIKFQTHIADAESTPAEPWRVKFSEQDATRYDYWRRMEFREEDWVSLRRHAEQRGLVFLSSPFSIVAVELLERVGVGAWKIASGEVTNEPLLQRIAQTGIPVVVSSGMSSWVELDQAIDLLRDAGVEIAVMQATSRYPTGPKEVGLNLLAELRERYGLPIGLSDHSGTIYPGLAATALGASIVEVHVTLHERAFGPDVPASLAPDDLRRLCEGVRYIGDALATPLDKDDMAGTMDDMRALFTRSIVAARDLSAGTVLAASDLALKKPGGGLPSSRLDEMRGRTLTRSLGKNEQLSESDLR